jgi:hypothetical protein
MRQGEILQLAVRCNLLDERVDALQNDARQGKRRPALLESNWPRNTLLETHSDGSPGAGSQLALGLGLEQSE